MGKFCSTTELLSKPLNEPSTALVDGF